VLYLLLAISASNTAAPAHHSQSAFDSNDPPRELKGTVAEYRWRNPHVLLYWDVKGENGRLVRWSGEFGSVALSLARGMSRDTFRVGEEVTVIVVPAKDGSPIGQLRRVVKADGTVVAGASD
jgi:hypothetical protein